MSKKLLGVMVLAAAPFGCGGDSPTSASGPPLRLSFRGLEPLQGGFHYEGWAVIDGQPFSTGKFNLGSDGSLRTLAGAPIAEGRFATGVDVGLASAIVITIEPAGDADALPAATKVLAGPVAGRMATLTAAAPQALGNDFAGAAGVFILATPTDGDGNNETSGIWFIDMRSGSPAAGLSLPVLPAGWTYEGWVVINGIPVTTGRFSRPAGADAAAPFSGPLPGPPFPGEDFIVNAPAGLSFPRDLGGATAVITVEPSPDDGPAPFAFKPLVGAIPAGTRDRVPLSLANRRSDFATGTATIG